MKYLCNIAHGHIYFMCIVQKENIEETDDEQRKFTFFSEDTGLVCRQ